MECASNRSETVRTTGCDYIKHREFLSERLSLNAYCLSKLYFSIGCVRASHTVYFYEVSFVLFSATLAQVKRTFLQHAHCTNHGFIFIFDGTCVIIELMHFLLELEHKRANEARKLCNNNTWFHSHIYIKHCFVCLAENLLRCVCVHIMSYEENVNNLFL